LVCSGCHDHILTAGVGRVAATGEFAAVTGEQAERLVATPRGTTETRGELRCNWCGKPQPDVKKLLSGREARICNECVALCADVLADELGPSWR
jgi:hypothetical protein